MAEYDLSTNSKWASLSNGSHTVKIKAKATGYKDSDFSASVTFEKVTTYNISTSLDNVGEDLHNPTTIKSNEDVTLTFTANSGYNLPTQPTVVGASIVSWSTTTGKLTLTNPTSDVSITINGVAQTYNVTTSLANCSKKSGPTTVTYGGTATFVFAATNGYDLPSLVTVDGATIDSYNQSTGTLVIKDVTGPVNITVMAVAKTFTVTMNLTHMTKTSGPTSVRYNGTASFVLAADTGYVLPFSMAIKITGATLNSWNRQTGVLSIKEITNNVTITAAGVPIPYDITPTLTHVVGSESNPSTITYGSTATLTYTAETGYELPDDVVVNGATYSWDSATGKLVLSNAVSDVTITIVGESAGVTLEAGTYKWIDSPVMENAPQLDFPISYLSNSEFFTKIYLGIYTSGQRTIGYNYYPSSSNPMKGYVVGHGWGSHGCDEDGEYTITTANTAYQTITISADQTVSQEFYDWAITANNLIKQEQPATSETWLLNENLTNVSLETTIINFTSNGVTYDRIMRLYNTEMDADELDYGKLGVEPFAIAFENGAWSDNAYRTITFDEIPTGNLLTWLQANGTKK